METTKLSEEYITPKSIDEQGTNPGAAQPKSSYVDVISARDILSFPSVDVNTATIKGNIVLKPGTYILRIYEPNMSPVYQPILDAISAASGYTADDLAGSSRKEPLVYYRKIFCLLCTRKGMPSTKIGEAIRRDHSTVLYHNHSFDVNRNQNAVLYRMLDEVKKHLKP